MKALRFLFEGMGASEWIALFLTLCFAFPGAALTMLQTVITIAFLLVGTFFAMVQKDTQVRAGVGILLYAASWPVFHLFGLWSSLLFFCAGVLTWWTAVLKGAEVLWRQAQSFPTR